MSLNTDPQNSLPQSAPGLSALRLGPLPIIRFILDRLRVREIIDAAVPKPQALVSNGECIEALVMAIFLDQQHALSRVSEVLAGYDLERLFRPGVQASHFHDTRLGEALDDLFVVAPGMYGNIVGQAIREFHVRIQRLNMDITKVLLQGEYFGAPDLKQDLPEIAIPARGWNPEGNWELKQLLFNLLVTEEKLPLLYSLGDGNASETKEYLAMMKRLDTIQADIKKAVLNVDSKGCDSRILLEASEQNLRLTTLVPETYSLQKTMREIASQSDMPLLDETDDGEQYNGLSFYRPELVDFVKGQEVHTERLWRYLVVYSTEKARRAKENREREIQDERECLEKALAKFSQKKVYACREDAEQEALAEIKRLKAEYHTIAWEAKSGAVVRGRGRPAGKGLKSNDKTGWGIDFSLEELPRPTPKFDPEGMFVLLCTVSDNRVLTDADILFGYKGRNVVEISFNWLKGDAAVAPVFLKKMTRIHSMGCVFVVWMLIYGLIQRELRRALKSRGGKCPHPDRRMVENPTTRGVLDLFTHVCVTTGNYLGRTIAQIQFWKPELDRVLELLGDPFLYDQYSRRATN